eukprot:4196473-Prymnesium_polylepis.1
MCAVRAPCACPLPPCDARRTVWRCDAMRSPLWRSHMNAAPHAAREQHAFITQPSRPHPSRHRCCPRPSARLVLASPTQKRTLRMAKPATC